MRRLLPTPAAEIDAYDLYRPADPLAPVLRLDMVAAADGAATDADDRTAGLGGPGDLEVFRSLRALADVILVGAGTVRAEGYGPHRLSQAMAARRAADGRSGPAPLAVVTRAVDLDFAAPLFTETAVPTIVVTCAAAPRDRRDAAAKAGRLIVAGDTHVDLGMALRVLRDDFGLPHVLCEGGPTLNATLLTAGLVDELCLSLAPRLIGGRPRRIVAEAGPGADLRLVALAESDGELYLRYEVIR